ncbi:MAG TPA: hypothetical protein VFQ36_04675, partial [Ktedonobacteraceae bacterium]|nr:hypothetical protein [Ktedonobacteraceae bacterium]
DAQWITTQEGKMARVVNAYFNEGIWTSSSSGGVRSRVGEHHRMLSAYLNTLVAARLVFEQMAEPAANDEISGRLPGNWEVPSILLIRASQGMKQRVTHILLHGTLERTNSLERR